MQMALYDIANNYLRALNEIIEIEDLPDDAIADTLEGLVGDVESKAINVAAFYKTLEAQVLAIKNIETEMTRRRKYLENRAERLKFYLQQNLEKCGITKITSSPWFTIRLQKSIPSVRIENISDIPQEFLVEKTTIEPDKVAIKRSILNGNVIPGAKLHQGAHLVIK